MEAHIGGKFSEGSLTKYIIGTYIVGRWRDCTEVFYKDIVAKYKKASYGEMFKLGYYKARGDWIIKL